MTKFFRTILLTLLSAPLVMAGAAGDDSPKDPLPGVKAQLAISVDEYDPREPSRGVVKCVVINKSGDPVEVSLGCGKSDNQLVGQGKDHKREVRLYHNVQAKEEQKRIRVKPGEQEVAFELSLDEILFQGYKNDPRIAKERTWQWHWLSRAETPVSPIHGWRVPGFVEEATFWAEVVVNGKVLFSKKRVLKVKPSGPK